MATLTYNGVELGLQRTLDVQDDAAYSPDGQDFLYREVTVDAICVINPATMAGIGINPGSSSAKIIKSIRQVLLTPQKQLLMKSGDDIIYDTPGFQPNGLPYTCDANGGPFPEHFSVLEFQGTKTIIARYRIKFYVNDCLEQRIVLSNRWNITSDTDTSGITTRTIEGWCIVDMGKFIAEFGNFSVDRFRNNFSIACPTNFKRINIQVTAQSDGSRAHYVVTDQEQTVNVQTPMNLEVTGNTTSGWETTIANTAGGYFGILPKLAVGATLPYSLLFLPAIAGDMPILKANGIVRVRGGRLVKKADLVQMALNLIVDRFSPLLMVNLFLDPLLALQQLKFGIICPVSCYITQDILENFVEVRMEFLVFPPFIKQGTTFKPDPDAIKAYFSPGMGINTTTEKNVIQTFDNETKNALFQQTDGTQIPIATWKNRPGAPVWFGAPSDNSRGSYLGLLITQALGGECKLPNVVPGQEIAVSTPLE